MGDIYMPDERVVLEPSHRRVRTYLNGQAVADSKAMLLLREPGRIPVYYFPREDVRMKWLETGDHQVHSAFKGEGTSWHVVVAGQRAENAAFTFHDPPGGGPRLDGHIGFIWERMDAWFEEDEEVFVHARDPYKRIDVMESSRHIKIIIDGETVAETRRPRLLFETGMPIRYYIPKADVRMDLLGASEQRTRCPYKGEAHYYTIKAGGRLQEGLVWSYRHPIPECPKIAGMLCFFNEKVEIEEDGILLQRPKTPWS